MDYVSKLSNSYLNQDVDALKQKVISEFKQLLKKIRKGYHPEYEFILQEISLIELWQLDNTDFFKQFYLNNAWQTQY